MTRIVHLCVADDIDAGGSLVLMRCGFVVNLGKHGELPDGHDFVFSNAIDLVDCEDGCLPHVEIEIVRIRERVT